MQNKTKFIFNFELLYLLLRFLLLYYSSSIQSGSPITPVGVCFAFASIGPSYIMADFRGLYFRYDDASIYLKKTCSP